MELWVARIVPVILGATGGFAYYRFIGCRTGGCPLTANPRTSTLWGAFVGSLLAG